MVYQLPEERDNCHHNAGKRLDFGMALAEDADAVDSVAVIVVDVCKSSVEQVGPNSLNFFIKII